MNLRTLPALLMLALATGCPGPQPAKTGAAKTGAASADPKLKEAQMVAKAIYGPLPARADDPKHPSSPEKIALGKALFYDGRLSKNGKISCNSCHKLDNFGVDGEPTSPGHTGERGTRNSPTVYNAALHTAGQFWDVREKDVEAQAKAPILNPVEMGMGGGEEVVKVLEGIPGYVELFKAAFPGQDKPVTYDNLGEAVGAFERTLMTPGRFDDFANGDLGALNADEVAGLQLFNSVGCSQCHTGPAFGGNAVKKLGEQVAWESKDQGRFEVTKQESDRLMFKVPSLRNVAKTGPYLHDGSIASLEEIVRKMAKHQLNKELDDDQVKKLVAFLGALTGRIDPSWTTAPTLPQ
ncbi:MAG: cytochrome-c peroxidase [Planctomycetota bacterium]